MPFYRTILKQSMKIAWQYKYLWFFGLFAAILGNGGEYNAVLYGVSGKGGGLFSWFSKVKEIGFFSGHTLANVVDNPSLIIIPLIIWVAMFVLVGFLVYLMIISQIAIIDNSAKIISSAKAKLNLNIADGVKAGQENFWKILGLNVLSKLALVIIFTIISLPIFLSFGRNGLASGLIYIILFVILIPMAIAFALVVKYAICYVIIRGSDLKNSLNEGWALFKANWLVSIEMAMILFLINFLVAVSLVLATLIFTIPALFLAYLMFILFSIAGFWITVGLSVTLVIVAVALIGASLAVFQTSSWTGLFLELIKKGGESKIVRVMSVK